MKDEHSNVDDYVSKQLESYYGKDVVSNVSRTAPPPPPPRRKSRLLSFGAVVCAVVFLTGALMVAGVFFAGGLPVSRTDSGSESASSAVSSVSESISAGSDSASSAVSSVSESISAGLESASSAVSSVSESISAGSESASSAVSSVSESIPAAASSKFSTSGGESEENSESPQHSSRRRDDSHALPEIDESDTYIIETAEEPSPNGSVTTGRRVRAGLGIFLMLASLASAAVLYNIYTEQEAET